MKYFEAQSNLILGDIMMRKRGEHFREHGRTKKARPRKAWLLDYRLSPEGRHTVVGIFSPRMKRKTVELIASGIWDCLQLCPGEMLTNLCSKHLPPSSGRRDLGRTWIQYESIIVDGNNAERGDIFVIGNKSGAHLVGFKVFALVEESNVISWQYN